MDSIEALPLVQTPEVFGLHANADIQYYTNATKDMWTNLIELQPRSGGVGGGISREDFIANVAKDIMAKIPDPFDMVVLKKEIGHPSPCQVVLLQELERWNGCAFILRFFASISTLCVPPVGLRGTHWRFC